MSIITIIIINIVWLGCSLCMDQKDIMELIQNW